MEETEFIETALQDTQLQELLRPVVAEIREEMEFAMPKSYSLGGVDIVMFLVAATVYRWAKDTLDHRRQRQENQILEQQTMLVAALVEKGLAAKEAQTLVTTLLKSIKERPADDPVLKKVLGLLQ